MGKSAYWLIGNCTDIDFFGDFNITIFHDFYVIRRCRILPGAPIIFSAAESLERLDLLVLRS